MTVPVPTVQGMTQYDIERTISTDGDKNKQAIFKLWQYQTLFEQSVDQTIDLNFQGFNDPDGSFYAKLVKKYIDGVQWTENEESEAKRRIKKYAGQLYRLMEQGEQVW